MPAARLLSFALLLGLTVGCGATPRPQQLPDGTLQVECDSEMSYCVRRAESFCGSDPVEIIAARSREGQHGDARYSDGATITTVQFVCGKSGAVDLRFRRKKADPPPVVASPSPPPAAVCAAGATQECVGAGACAGGQACKPDGSGWGDCDCGDSRAPSVPATDPAAAPDDDPEPQPSAD